MKRYLICNIRTTESCKNQARVCGCAWLWVCARAVVLLNTYTYILYNYWHLGNFSCLFKGGSNCFIREQSIFLLLYGVLLIFRCLRLLKAGRREQSQFRQIHCTVTYFIVLFLEGNKNAPCFLMYFMKLKTNGTYCKCFWRTVEWTFWLILFLLPDSLKLFT